MMNKCVAGFAFAVAMIAASAAWALDRIGDVTDMRVLRAAVKADKKAFVASALNVTPTEAKKFWPIYDAYQRTLDRVNRERNLVIVDIVGSDKPLTDAYAKYLLKDMIEAAEAEIRARRTLQNKLVKAVPAEKAAR